MQKNWNQTNSKQLYLLHIPKTGGTSVSATLRHALSSRDLIWHKNARPPHNYDFSDFIFIDAHLGNSSRIISKNTEVACLVRNPIDRAVSNFLWIHDSVLSKNIRYKTIEKISDRLRYFLFEDEDYLFHQNIQSKFICNPVSDSVFSENFSFKYEEYSKTWFIENFPISAKLAIRNVNKFELVGTTDCHKEFMKSISIWMESNLGISVLEEDYEHALKSELNTENQLITTDILVEQLSSYELKRIIENNIIDYEVYRHVKNNQLFSASVEPSSVIV